jgi:DNA-binding NtrC family response regulator
MAGESTICFLVDDDIDDQEIFNIAMKDVDSSICCVFVNDGVQALQKINEDESFIPHCIFIDMNMPRMNGLQCLEAIKKIPRLQSVPVYMYSTSSDPKSVAETRDMGAIDFIVKPSSISTLSSILKPIFKV